MFARRPVEEILRSVAIPTPSSLVAQMLGLRVAALKADDAYCDPASVRADVFLADRRQVEIRVKFDYFDNGYHQEIVNDFSVTIYETGKSTRSIDFTNAERLPLLNAMRELVRRSRVARDLRRDAEKQNLSLSVLEGLL